MADQLLTSLPSAVALTGAEVLYGVQSNASVKISANQIKTFANTISAPLQGTFSSTASQTITNAANDLALSYDTQTDVYGLTLTAGTKIGFTTTGTFALSFSAICHNPVSSSAKWANIYLKKNGGLVDNSSTIITLAKDSPTAVVCTFVFDVTNITDTYELYLAAQQAGIQVLATEIGRVHV